MVDIHPLADPDGLLRDGDCRRLYFMNRVQKVPPVQALRALFSAYNDRFWDGKLNQPVLVLAPDLEVASQLDWENPPMVLTINQDVYDSAYEEARDVILHEMCHLYLRDNCNYAGEVSHTPEWIQEAVRVGVLLEGCDG